MRDRVRFPTIDPFGAFDDNSRARRLSSTPHHAAVALEAPYLSQRTRHPNAAMNCVPTVLAMTAQHFRPDLARIHGNALTGVIADAMLEIEGSRGVAGLSSYRTLGVLGRILGLRLERHPGLDPVALHRAVATGRHAIVIGDAYALAYARSLNLALVDDAGHAILVHDFRRIPQAFAVNDPAEPGERERNVSAAELRAFVHALSADLDGGPAGSTVYVSRAF